MRVVSLLPSATEIVCALGAGDRLVGVSHECDHPAEVRGLPVLTGSRVGMGGSSGAIDRAVRAMVQDALSLYAVDDSLLARLRPDVIVTQDLCEVCAVSLEDVQAAVARWTRQESVRIVSLRPTRLRDVLDDVVCVGEALELLDEARDVRATLAVRMDRIRERALATGRRPRVASVEWLDPLMLGGTWMPELIAVAGGEPVGAEPGQLAPTVAPEELAALRPDVVLVKPCGFPVARTLEERVLVEERLLAALPAETRVYLTDGNAYFNRPGPRLVESAEILAACTHPEAFPELAARHAAHCVRWR